MDELDHAGFQLLFARSKSVVQLTCLACGRTDYSVIHLVPMLITWAREHTEQCHEPF